MRKDQNLGEYLQSQGVENKRKLIKRLMREHEGDLTMYRGKGCEACQFSGFRGRIPVAEYTEHFEESHVAHSNALQCRLRDGSSYLCGPMARINRSTVQRAT